MALLRHMTSGIFKLVNIGSCNEPINADYCFGPLGTHFNEIESKYNNFHSSGKDVCEMATIFFRPQYVTILINTLFVITYVIFFAQFAWINAQTTLTRTPPFCVIAHTFCKYDVPSKWDMFGLNHGLFNWAPKYLKKCFPLSLCVLYITM